MRLETKRRLPVRFHETKSEHWDFFVDCLLGCARAAGTHFLRNSGGEALKILLEALGQFARLGVIIRRILPSISRSQDFGRHPFAGCRYVQAENRIRLCRDTPQLATELGEAITETGKARSASRKAISNNRKYPTLRFFAGCSISFESRAA